MKYERVKQKQDVKQTQEWKDVAKLNYEILVFSAKFFAQLSYVYANNVLQAEESF